MDENTIKFVVCEVFRKLEIVDKSFDSFQLANTTAPGRYRIILYGGLVWVVNVVFLCGDNIKTYKVNAVLYDNQKKVDEFSTLANVNLTNGKKAVKLLRELI